jgi:hypothetical protein
MAYSPASRLRRSLRSSLALGTILFFASACSDETETTPGATTGATNSGLPTAPTGTGGAVTSPGSTPLQGGSTQGASGTGSTGTGSTGAGSTGAGSTGATSVGGGAPTTGTADPTWCKAKEVIATRCVSCHDGAGTAGTPYGLKTYADAAKVATRIGIRVHAEKAMAEGKGTMPPKTPLTATELAAVDAWIAGGAKGSDQSCTSGATTPTAAADVWPPKECDEVYKILAHGSGKDEPYMVQANAETHPQINVDAPWGNESVQAIAFHPITDNKKVLHHWILYASNGAFLTGWAPGDDERTPMPKDVGMDMPTGPGSLRLDMHYFNTGNSSAEPDMSGLEVCVVKGANKRKYSSAVTMGLMSIGGLGGLAPANTENHDATSTCTVQAKEPVHILSAAPHAHKYAVHMKFTVKHKDGTVRVMHDMPFMFGEQGTYPLDPEEIVNTGDVITTTCTYTNKTNRNITFGESTTDEMCFNFALYYPKGAFSCGGGGAIAFPTF